MPGFNRRKFIAKAGTAAVGLTASVGTAAAKAKKWQQRDLTFDISCENNSTDNKTVKVIWKWRDSFYDGYEGEDPEDVIGFYWDRRKWTQVDPNERTSEDIRFQGSYDEDGGEYRGVVFRHDDSEHSRWGDNNDYCHASIILSPRGDWTERERNVFLDYYHTYNDYSIDSFGVEAFGIQIDPDKEEKRWHKARETDHADSECYDHCC